MSNILNNLGNQIQNIDLSHIHSFHWHNKDHSHDTTSTPLQTVQPTTSTQPMRTTTTRALETTTNTPSIQSCMLPDNSYRNDYSRQNSFVSIDKRSNGFSLFPTKVNDNWKERYLTKQKTFTKKEFSETTSSIPNLKNTDPVYVQNSIKNYIRSYFNITTSSPNTIDERERPHNILLSNFFNNSNLRKIKQLAEDDYIGVTYSGPTPRPQNLLSNEQKLKISRLIDTNLFRLMEYVYINFAVKRDIPDPKTTTFLINTQPSQEKFYDINNLQNSLNFLNNKVKTELVLRLIRDKGGYNSVDVVKKQEVTLAPLMGITGQYLILGNNSVSEIQKEIVNQVRELSGGKYNIGMPAREKIIIMLRYFFLENTINGPTWIHGKPKDCKNFKVRCFDNEFKNKAQQEEQELLYKKADRTNQMRNLVYNFESLGSVKEKQGIASAISGQGYAEGFEDPGSLIIPRNRQDKFQANPPTTTTTTTRQPTTTTTTTRRPTTTTIPPTTTTTTTTLHPNSVYDLTKEQKDRLQLAKECSKLAVSPSGNSHPEGCLGAVDNLGVPSQSLCKNTNGRSPWLAKCCDWKVPDTANPNGKCDAKEFNIDYSQYKRKILTGLSPKVSLDMLRKLNEEYEPDIWDKFYKEDSDILLETGEFKDQLVNRLDVQTMVVNYFVSSILAHIPNYIEYLDDIQNPNKTICYPKNTRDYGKNNTYKIKDGLF